MGEKKANEGESDLLNSPEIDGLGFIGVLAVMDSIAGRNVSTFTAPTVCVVAAFVTREAPVASTLSMTPSTGSDIPIHAGAKDIIGGK